MSKWSKRSDEEKRSILEKQNNIKKTTERKHNRGTLLILEDSDGVKVYLNKEIPLACLNCGWVGSDKYTIYINKDNPFAIGHTFIKGTCRKCGQILNRIFPNPLESEGMIFMLTLPVLNSQGRIKDERPKEVVGRFDVLDVK